MSIDICTCPGNEGDRIADSLEESDSDCGEDDDMTSKTASFKQRAFRLSVVAIRWVAQIEVQATEFLKSYTSLRLYEMME
jgi:hypothetical protein